MADAEDAVQETYVRWHGVEHATVSDPRAFLMTTTTGICLDMLTPARARRRALYVVRNPDKLRHLARARDASGRA